MCVCEEVGRGNDDTDTHSHTHLRFFLLSAGSSFAWIDTHKQRAPIERGARRPYRLLWCCQTAAAVNGVNGVWVVVWSNNESNTGESTLLLLLLLPRWKITSVFWMLIWCLFVYLFLKQFKVVKCKLERFWRSFWFLAFVFYSGGKSILIWALFFIPFSLSLNKLSNGEKTRSKSFAFERQHLSGWIIYSVAAAAGAEKFGRFYFLTKKNLFDRFEYLPFFAAAVDVFLSLLSCLPSKSVCANAILVGCNRLPPPPPRSSFLMLCSIHKEQKLISSRAHSFVTFLLACLLQ